MMQIMDMYVEDEEKNKSKKFWKILKTVGVILWVIMIVVSILLTSRSVVVIN